MGYKVAVIGATGNVGREMLNILEEREFPADEVIPIASRRSVGREVSYGDGFSNVPAPVFGHGMVYVATGFQVPSLLAVRAGGRGNVTATHTA